MIIIRHFFLLITLTIATNCFAGDYPKPKIEQEMEEMGSILQGEGIVFRPKKTKSSATKAKIGNVNKYLYQATMDVLDFAPLASADSNTGIIITEWYSPKGQPNVQLKINVFIKDEVISTEAIEVRTFERSKVKGKWSNSRSKQEINSILEDQILRRARTLYQEER